MQFFTGKQLANALSYKTFLYSHGCIRIQFMDKTTLGSAAILGIRYASSSYVGVSGYLCYNRTATHLTANQ